MIATIRMCMATTLIPCVLAIRFGDLTEAVKGTIHAG
jgi:hypothetical protein